MEAIEISILCEKYPGKYKAPSDFYMKQLNNPFRAVEIDRQIALMASEHQNSVLNKLSDKDPTTTDPEYSNPLIQHRKVDCARTNSNRDQC